MDVQTETTPMNVKLLLISSLVFALGAFAGAQQIDPQKAKESDLIVANMRRLELLNQILPLVLTRQQINAILPSIERVRDKIRQLYLTEHDNLMEFQNKAKSSVDAGVKGQMPDNKLVTDIRAFFQANDVRRQSVVEHNIDIIMPVLLKNLNKGQMKVMANSLTLAFFEPDIKPQDANDDIKQRIFVREVLMDPLTYDLLIQMSTKLP
jgi:hypothetical protein